MPLVLWHVVAATNRLNRKWITNYEFDLLIWIYDSFNSFIIRETDWGCVKYMVHAVVACGAHDFHGIFEVKWMRESVIKMRAWVIIQHICYKPRERSFKGNCSPFRLSLVYSIYICVNGCSSMIWNTHYHITNSFAYLISISCAAFLSNNAQRLYNYI